MGDTQGRCWPAGSPCSDGCTGFGSDSTIAALAEAIRLGDPDAVLDLLRAGHRDVRWVPDTDAAAVDDVVGQLVEAGVELVLGARAGRCGRVRWLPPDASSCWLRPGTDRSASTTGATGSKRRGRPTATAQAHPPVVRGPTGHRDGNDRLNRVANGDVGVVVGRESGMEIALASEDGVRMIAPSRLDRVESWWAMTIHKSQGSEFPHAVVSLPRAGSPILTRELLYTGVTRARDQLTLVASESSIRAAVDRPVARASGLAARLWDS